MDPLMLAATAVALGSASGAGDVAKQVVGDSYSALKALILRRYGAVEADVVSVESEPEEPLRRQLLARQLDKAGAAEDQELQAAAHEMLRLIADHAPAAAATVGVALTRVAVDGDIEITDVHAAGAAGVSATDVSAGGSLKIAGVNAAIQEPPHPSPARR